MRTVVLAAAVVSALSLGAPGLASAQDPEPAPPQTKAAPKQGAVPRSERVARDTPARAADGPDSAPAVRQPRSAERNPARDPQTAVEGRARREPRAATEVESRVEPTNASAAATPDEEQRSGGQRRGAVRRPPSGGTSRGESPRGQSGTVDRAVPRSEAPRGSNRVYVFPELLPQPATTAITTRGATAASGWVTSTTRPGAGTRATTAPTVTARRMATRVQATVDTADDAGSVKLKVKPRDAEVFVDGYFAGVVDDFDGVLQALKLDSGAYNIEIRKPGFEPLRFDVRVQPDRSITFRGEMKPAP